MSMPFFPGASWIIQIDVKVAADNTRPRGWGDSTKGSNYFSLAAGRQVDREIGDRPLARESSNRGLNGTPGHEDALTNHTSGPRADNGHSTLRPTVGSGPSEAVSELRVRKEAAAPDGCCFPIPVGFLKKDHGSLIRKLQEQLTLGSCPICTGVGEPPQVPSHNTAGSGNPGAPDPVLGTLC